VGWTFSCRFGATNGVTKKRERGGWASALSGCPYTEPKNTRCIRCKGYLSFMSARIVLSCFPVSHRVVRFIAASGNAVGVGF
jgi:hypothetical protein